MNETLRGIIQHLEVLCNYVDDALAIEPNLLLTDKTVVKAHTDRCRKLMAVVWRQPKEKGHD